MNELKVEIQKLAGVVAAVSVPLMTLYSASAMAEQQTPNALPDLDSHFAIEPLNLEDSMKMDASDELSSELQALEQTFPALGKASIAERWENMDGFEKFQHIATAIPPVLVSTQIRGRHS